MEEPRATLVSGYEVLGILGQGGFGIVYRARQLAVGREVALKIDNRVLVSDRDRRRFMREVTSAGSLSGHPHVADVYDAGVLPDGRPYMVLELCPGGSLADRLKRHGPLSAREVRDIGVKIADALAAAHAAGVLHRDVKPANILINSYGMVALSDFGLAAMPTQGGEVSVTREALTPAYAPPEAFDLSEPMATGDVYALAATLYALLYGRPPRFPENGVVNITTIMALHRLPVPDIPGVPSALTDVLRRGLATDLGQRLQSAAELRDALSALHVDGSAAAGAVPDQRSPSTVAHPGGPPFGGPGVVAPPNVTAVMPPPGYAGMGPDGGPPLARNSMPTLAGANAGPDPRWASTAPGAVGVARPPGAPYANSGLITQIPPARKSRQSVVFGVITALFALLLVAGIGMLILENKDQQGQTQPTGTSAAGAAGTGGSDPSGTATAALGVATRTDDCPAATVTGAACVAEPECWGGVNSRAGDVTARTVPCAKPHYWETFAIARLPDAVTTYDQETVSKDPTVARLCKKAILLKSRTGAAKAITADKWQVSVMPPSEARFVSGVRTYRCIGNIPGPERTSTDFGV